MILSSDTRRQSIVPLVKLRMRHRCSVDGSLIVSKHHSVVFDWYAKIPEGHAYVNDINSQSWVDNQNTFAVELWLHNNNNNNNKQDFFALLRATRTQWLATARRGTSHYCHCDSLL